MEKELRDQLLVTSSALQIVVGVLVKNARNTNPNFDKEVEDLISEHFKQDHPETREATLKAVKNLLSA